MNKIHKMGRPSCQSCSSRLLLLFLDVLADDLSGPLEVIGGERASLPGASGYLLLLTLRSARPLGSALNCRICSVAFSERRPGLRATSILYFLILL